MEFAFNAGKVLEIACQLEKNGAKFYRRAAELAASDDMKTVFFELAEMEDNHLSLFESMRDDEDVVAGLLATPDDLLTTYLRALAGSQIFNKDVPKEYFAEGVSPQKILEKAIQLEMETIAYYHGIREKMPNKRNKRRVSDIIHEEMGHVALLAEKLFAVKAPKKS